MKDYFARNYTNLPVFIGGDFNEEPQNEPITIMKSGFSDLYHSMRIQCEETDPETLNPKFTTFKYREKDKGWVKRTIDYIFMAKNEYYNKHGV